MASKEQDSTKRLAITKANAQIVAVVAIASFVTVFCLIAAKTVLGTNLYQAKVTTKQQKALAQLKTDIQAYNTLRSSYDEFVGQSPNIIDGDKNGSGDNDGDNAKIILDALPYKYDFPALTASIEKILQDRGLQITGINGSDDQLAQQNNLSSPTPAAVPMPFSFSIDNASYDSTSQLILALQHSIRPIQIDMLTMSGNNQDMTVTVNAHTYYQPSKDVNITQQVLK